MLGVSLFLPKIMFYWVYGMHSQNSRDFRWGWNADSSYNVLHNQFDYGRRGMTSHFFLFSRRPDSLRKICETDLAEYRFHGLKSSPGPCRIIFKHIYSDFDFLFSYSLNSHPLPLIHSPSFKVIIWSFVLIFCVHNTQVLFFSLCILRPLY